MSIKELTAVGLELNPDTEQLIVKLFSKKEYSSDIPPNDPFSEFVIAAQNYSKFIQMLIKLGIDLQQQSKIDLGLPEEIEEGVSV